MDQSLVASIRKTLEAKPTEELRRSYESVDKATRSLEELEAMRQLLYERRTRSTRTVIALSSAVLIGTLGATGAWWQGASEGFVCLAGVGGAILGFALWYIPDLIPRT